MNSETLTLSELSSVELENLLENATPALRRAVLRGQGAGDGNDVGSFCSFIDADLAE
ncbi:hypothetical protein [Nocardia sp. NBC_00403]|uniref:hypothetical protein n=1 Tax=Nocardia sp. NBC_00403 TaxID=2975990 RepID=UPI002E239BAC